MIVQNVFQSHFSPLYPVRNNAPLEFLTGFTSSDTLDG